MIMILLITRRIKATYMARLLYNYNLSIYSKSAYFSDNYSQMEMIIYVTSGSIFSYDDKYTDFYKMIIKNLQIQLTLTLNYLVL